MRTLKEIFGIFNKPEPAIKAVARPVGKEEIVDNIQYVIGRKSVPAEVVSLKALEKALPDQDFSKLRVHYDEYAAYAKTLQFYIDAATAWRMAICHARDNGIEKVPFDQIRKVAQAIFAEVALTFIGSETYNSVNIFNDVSEEIAEAVRNGKTAMDFYPPEEAPYKTKISKKPASTDKETK